MSQYNKLSEISDIGCAPPFGTVLTSWYPHHDHRIMRVNGRPNLFMSQHALVCNSSMIMILLVHKPKVYRQYHWCFVLC